LYLSQERKQVLEIDIINQHCSRNGCFIGWDTQYFRKNTTEKGTGINKEILVLLATVFALTSLFLSISQIEFEMKL
jgi:hypothetical protein